MWETDSTINKKVNYAILKEDREKGAVYEKEYKSGKGWKRVDNKKTET